VKIFIEQEYKTRQSINSKIKIDDMNKDAKEFYFSIYSLYMELLYKYLMKKIDIVTYDNKLRSIGFDKIIEDDMDFYQMFSTTNLNYFYIRNNLYMERLDSSDVEFLGDRVIKQNDNLDKEAEEFVERTYKKLIFENVTGDYNTNFVINFGPDSPKFYTPVNSLVIGIRYKEDLIKENNQNNLKLYSRKRMFVDNLCLEMSKKYTEILSIPVSVISYDENSVKKKINLEDSYKK